MIFVLVTVNNKYSYKNRSSQFFLPFSNVSCFIKAISLSIHYFVSDSLFANQTGVEYCTNIFPDLSWAKIVPIAPTLLH